MSAAEFAAIKDLKARVAALEEAVKALQEQRPTLTLPKKDAKAA